MGEKTSIGWTDSTWNPLRGTLGRWHCVRISAACKFCYAARMNHRFHGPDYTVGADTPRLDEKALTLPLRWRKGRRIFVCSMTDLFLDAHTDEWIDRVFAVMALAPQHTFQVLTKRPERMRAYLEPGRGRFRFTLYDRVLREANALRSAFRSKRLTEIGISDPARYPLPNVHLGVSVEDQATADERVPLLLQTPAAVRFVSYEPALAAVEFGDWFTRICCRYDRGQRDDGTDACNGPGCLGTCLDWLIVGGESGPGARPFDVAWARSTIAACKAAGVACFVKQLGARPYIDAREPAGSTGRMPCLKRGAPEEGRHGRDYLVLRDRKGADPAEWPADLRVQQFPSEVVLSERRG